MDERLLIDLSAYADGELAPAARAAVEAQLARAEVRAALDAVKRLDDAAAELPAPKLDPQAGVPFAQTEALSADVAQKIDAAAAGWPAPEISAERFAQAWTHIAARTLAAPEINAARWDAAWGKISARTAGGKIVKGDFQAWRRRARLRWILASGLAAAVALAVYCSWPAAETGGDYAMIVPESLDARYSVRVKFLQGRTTPVVCLLKADDEDDDDSID